MEEGGPAEGPGGPGRRSVIEAFGKRWVVVRLALQLIEAGLVLTEHETLAWTARVLVMMGDALDASRAE